MGKDSGISWTNHTFNIVWGCTKLSPACQSCYAEAWAMRYGVGWGPTAERRTFGEKHWLDPVRWARSAARRGVRERVFTSSMADVFEDHPVVANERMKLWSVIDATWHAIDYLVLTKRIDRVVDALAADGLPDDYLARRGVWLGTTVENQEWADRRIPHLLATPAAVRFLSVEPMLGPINLGLWRVERVNNFWVIVGGESGAKARPMHPDWARGVRDQCAAAGIPFLFKQWGEWAPISDDTPRGSRLGFVQPDGHISMAISGYEPGCPCDHNPRDEPMVRVGKKTVGRLLDGVLHDAFPLAVLTEAR